MQRSRLVVLNRCSIILAATLTALPSRIIDCCGLKTARVTFTWRDYRDSAASKHMTLEAEEFIRRFLLHVLPDGSQKIR